MADANLLEILRIESKLDNMVVFGKIRCAISKPHYLSSNVSVTDGFFALVDVFALRCDGVDYFSKHSNYQDSKHIYFSKGSMVVVINDKELVGKNVRVYGRTLKGCTIKKQKTSNIKDGVVAFAWTKMNGNWCILPNKVLPFGVSDTKGTVLEDYIVSLVNGEDFTFTHPSTTDSVLEYEGVEGAESLSFENIKGGFEYSSDNIDLTKISLNLVHRLKANPVSEYADAVGEAVKELKEKKKVYAIDLIDDIKNNVDAEIQGNGVLGEDLDIVAGNIVSGFINNIASRYGFNLDSGVKAKGRLFVDTLLDDMYTVKFSSGEDNSSDGSDISFDLYKEIESLKRNVPLDHSLLFPERNTIPVLKDYTKFASLVIGCVTGIGVSTMVSNYNSMKRYNDLTLDDWFWCLIRNPYLCGLMGAEFNIHDCDRIYFGFTCMMSGGHDFNDCMKYRDMLLMLDCIKNASSRSTLIGKRDLGNPLDRYPALGKRYLEDNGSPYNKDCRAAVSLVNGGTLVLAEKRVLERNLNVKKVLNDLLVAGLIEEVNDGVILSSDLNKEYVIYSKLIEKGSQLTGISDDEVSETIIEFEKQRGFNLEVLQKDGIYLTKYKAGVLSGCAGSGKTTTSDCMVMAIENHLSGYKLRFGAPTGKAARRLAEVVGGNVKTIHSMFGLGLGGEPYITKKDRFRRKSDEGVSYAYFLDEMAMCNSNLMYEIVDHLNDDDLVYFLGDIKQLSPIGKGSPFRSLMKFLPCVELGVSKRAAANGKINYNVGLINFVSDDRIVELQEGDDFKILPCVDAEIQKNTVNAFSNALSEGYVEDDIQVVTGYQTDKYPWSTVNLNPLLQKLLRKDEEMLYMYNDQKFMRNDRVIHVKRNAYDMQRFKMKDKTTFEEVVTFGVVNGELGKIVGYMRSDMCTIIPWKDEFSDEQWEDMTPDMRALIEKRREKEDLRNDSEIKDENTYFIIVQVYDVDLREDVVILYRATYKEELSNDFYARTFSGGDLKYMELAYALTTHKMQGSQNPCIIIPLGSTSSAQFMNRNMLNTMTTRASKKVVLIGSVRGKNSALTNGRRLTNVDDGEDVLGLLCD